MIYISNGNSLNTFYGLSASNLYSCNSFTNDLYISGNIYGANLITANVTTGLNAATIVSGAYYGNGYGLSNLNASNITGTISNTNLPPSGVTPGTYGSGSNVSQITVDQYGLVTGATNVSILSSQWVAVDANIAYQNGVSIGTLVNPPVGSNLYVLGSANITDTLNVSTLYVNSATVFGSSTLNVFGISNLNSVLASLYIGDGSGISNLNASNLVGNSSAAEVASSVTNPAQPNITSVGTLTGLNVQGLLIVSNGSGISNINSSNLVGNVAAANVALVVSQPAQPNITSVGTLTGLSVQGLLIVSNGSGISNINSSNLVGNVANANVALVVSQAAQPNITSVGTLTGLNVQGLLIVSNGSGLSNVNASNLVGNVANANVALVVSQAAQPNITSLGTLTGLNVQGLLIVSNGSGISNLNSSNLVGNVAVANIATSVTNPAQPNITSVGTLTGLTVGGVLQTSLFIGNGSGISNINGSNVVSTVGTAQSVTAAAQPNITSVGTLTSLSVTGTIVAGTFAGDGQGLFGIHSNAIIDTVATANSVVQPAQPNITSVGTLTGLTVAGLLIAANGSGISNLNSSNLTGTISTGRLPVSGVTAGLYGSGANVSSVTVDQYGRVTNATNVAITASQWTSNTGNTIYYANYVGIGTTFVPTANLHVIGNAYVSNSVTTTNIFFTNAIQATNLPASGVAAGGYGSVANIPQIVVDQYGRLTSASNVTLPPVSQWTSVDSNVAFGNGVSIGTLTNPPAGSNLYVFGTANIDAINTSSLSISNLNLVSSSIITLLVPTQLNAASANILTDNVITSNILTANVGTLNVSGVANVTNLTVRTFANLATANVPILNVSSTANIANLRVNTLANLVSANVTTANVATGNVTTANIVKLNVSSGANIANLRVSTFANIATLNVSTIFGTYSNLVAANVTTGNVLTLNASSIFGSVSNLVTANVTNLTVQTQANSVSSNITTANIATLNASSIFGTNSNLVTANVTTGNVLTLNASSILGTNSNLLSANVTTGNVLTLNASSIFGTNSNLLSANVTTGNVLTLNASSIFGTNSNLVSANVTTGNVLTLNASSIFGTNSNLTTLNASSIFGTNSNLLTANVTTGNIRTLNASSIFGTNSNLVTANVTTGNVLTLNASSFFGTNSNLLSANVTTGNVLTLNASSIFVTNSNLLSANVTTENVLTLNASSIFATNSNLVTLDTSSISVSNQANIFSSNLVTANVETLNTQFLTVTSNILPGAPTGNTYLTGNIIVSGNVFSALGMPLGSGGGYYFSLPGDVALQTPYTGAVYGVTYPLSVGLSNGFTISGTSTLITVTPNGNFKFGVAGPYLLRAVFNSTDNIKGLAVGSNVADVHGTDQGYMYRYTTFITQNPTELIEIPFNVTDVSKYYYLDLFSVDGGTLRQTANTSGGTYLTITPLTGGGLATGGPGGTPGTQWISSGSNIYYSNSVGIGAVNPTYALTVTGQGYFSQEVSYDNFAGFRNRLINGTFRVASRANTLTVSNTSTFSVSNAFVVDRWFVDSGNLSTSNVAMTIKQDAPLGQTNGFANVANVFVTSAFGATLDNTWICPLVQTVEASGTYDLRFGQATAKPMVLSFYANAAVTGNYSVVLRSKADNTYYANLVTLTNSWNRYTVYVPACTIGTWGTNLNGSVEVCLLGVSFGSGRANVAPTVSWTASPGYAPVACTGAVNWMASAPSQLQVTGVQLELGTITTPFEIRLLSETVRLCQRYYETNPDTQYAAALGSGRVNSVPFVVTKRNHANVTVYTTQSNLLANTNISTFTSITSGGSYANTAVTSYTTSEYGYTFNFIQGGGSNKIDEAQFVWQADSEIY